MRKAGIIVIVLALVATASAQQSWFPGTFDQALAKAKAESKLVLIDFFSGG